MQHLSSTGGTAVARTTATTFVALSIATAFALLGLARPSAASVGIWTSAAELAALPTHGEAWESLLEEASEPLGVPDLADTRSATDVRVMARALVYARTGDEVLRDEVVAACMAAIGTEQGGATLALGRGLAAYVIAADLVGLAADDDAVFRAWLASVRTTDLGGRTLVSAHEDRPNNWGTHAGASRIAVALYLGDDVELERSAAVFRGWLGDRASHADFSYGNDSWHPDPDRPVGINPAGTTKDGYPVDGVLADDQRRGGKFAWPPVKEGYVYEGLQGALAQAVMLHRAGHDVWQWQDRALLRAFEWLYNEADYPAEGDDSWQPYLVNHYYGTAFSSRVPSRAGKNVGWTDWTHAANDPFASCATACDDGDPCNGYESCQDGQCVAGRAGPSCNDGDSCTIDTCEPMLGCRHDDAGCAEVDISVVDDPCTDDECDDGLICTLDVCSEDTGECDHTPDDFACDNGAFCDGFERCDGWLGCVAGPAPCDDLIECTIDSCDEGDDGCDNLPDHSRCDDGLFCNGAEACNPVLACTPGVPPCPQDLCDEEADVCTATPACTDDGDCADANACTIDTCDGAGVCVSTPLACDDGDPCTTDSCDVAGGCSHVDVCPAGAAGEVTLEEVQTGTAVEMAVLETALPVVAAPASYYVAAVATKSRTDVVTVDGLGLSWTRAGAQCGGRDQTGVEVWVATGSPAASTAVTATLAATPRSAVLTVARYTGVRAGDALGAIATANTNGAGGACSGGSDSSSYRFDLPARETGSTVFVAAAMRNRRHTPGAGFTEHWEARAGSGGRVASLAVADGRFTGPSPMSVGGSLSKKTDWAVVAVELLAAPDQ